MVSSQFYLKRWWLASLWALWLSKNWNLDLISLLPPLSCYSSSYLKSCKDELPLEKREIRCINLRRNQLIMFSPLSYSLVQNNTNNLNNCIFLDIEKIELQFEIFFSPLSPFVIFEFLPSIYDWYRILGELKNNLYIFLGILNTFVAET